MAKKTSQELKNPPNKKQMSNKAIQELIRPKVPALIARAIYLSENATNESVQIGAIKTLLAKVVPDLKAVEYKGEDGQTLEALVIVRANGNKTIPVANDRLG